MLNSGDGFCPGHDYLGFQGDQMDEKKEQGDPRPQAGCGTNRADGPLRVLVAEDERITRETLREALTQWGYEVLEARDGTEAWAILTGENRPSLAVLDWMMPGMEGVEICRRLGEIGGPTPPYVILVTGRDQIEDLALGLNSGAQDYIPKPFHAAELRARLRVGERVVRLQSALAARVKDLEQAMGQVKTLRGLLPICSHCKKIRDDRNYWQQLEEYLAVHTEAQFTHSVCPECYEKFFKRELEELRRTAEEDQG
jgi:phosphoserine phosphatase RsbU/P